jgi:FkbM family methyltransferase
MSLAPTSAWRGQIRHLLAAAGALGLTRRAIRLRSDLRCAVRRDFRLVIEGKEVRFVTDDSHSTRFFHRRYRRGELHEPPVSAELARRARRARVFADVGAHVGYYSCIAGALNEHLSLFLFEMNRDMVGAIARNLAANGLSDAVIVNRPVADRHRLVGYARASREPGLSMRDPAGAAESGLVPAETVTLDAFFAERGAWPDLIKIDVEGAELEVLRGAREIVARHHPVLFVEVHPRLLGNFGSSAEQVYAFLREHGYALERFVGHRTGRAGLEPIPAAAALPETTHMLLCV